MPEVTEARMNVLKQQARDQVFTYEFAFRRRYNLMPDDPAMKHISLEEKIVDYWCHAIWEDPHIMTLPVSVEQHEAHRR